MTLSIPKPPISSFIILGGGRTNILHRHHCPCTSAAHASPRFQSSPTRSSWPWPITHVRRVLPLKTQTKLVRNYRALLHETLPLDQQWWPITTTNCAYRASTLPEAAPGGYRSHPSCLFNRPVLTGWSTISATATAPRGRSINLCEIQPDLVYSTSHVHGVNGGGLAIRVARRWAFPLPAAQCSLGTTSPQHAYFEPGPLPDVDRKGCANCCCQQYPALDPAGVTDHRHPTVRLPWPEFC